MNLKTHIVLQSLNDLVTKKNINKKLSFYRSDETGKRLKLSKRKETSCFFVLLI